MQEYYTIKLDASIGFIHVIFKGQWTSDTVEKYAADRRAIATRMSQQNYKMRDSRLLVDVREQGAQPLEVIEKLTDLVKDPDLLVSRTAVLVTSALRSRQAGRVVPRQAVFTSESEALDWLLDR